MSDTNVLTRLYGIFHLNLAFSSIEREQHAEVVSRCYWPLLKLIQEHDIQLGLELSVYTLEAIADADPQWVIAFKKLLMEGKCELLASGDSQIIGPLIPVQVNQWNQQLGLDAYQRYLGVRPALAYVNEQAVSRSLLDMYLDMGFSAVVIEWDNPHSFHLDWPMEYLFQPVQALTASGRTIPVLWNWSIAFQKLQRLAHNQLSQDDYLNFVGDFASINGCFPVYGNDAEVFDFRPGRFSEEADFIENEWQKIEQAFVTLGTQYKWTNPQDVVSQLLRADSPILEISHDCYPVVVKKQRKYNLTRWALSGRDDLWLNTACHRLYRQLKQQPSVSDEEQRALCRLWASDFRTHLTEKRYKALLKSIPEAALPSIVEEQKSEIAQNKSVERDLCEGCAFDAERNWLTVTYESLTLVLNMARGGAIVSLYFHSQDEPVIGTLDHGYFLGIELGADFYSNHLVVELPSERRRVADLNEVSWRVKRDEQAILVSVQQSLPLGTLAKTYQITVEGLQCSYHFPDWERPEGSLRLGWMTLLNTRDEGVRLRSHYGGKEMEDSYIQDDVDYGQPASTLVSASSCIGATEGELHVRASQSSGIKLRWDPALCAAIPMLYNRKVGQDRLSRIFFSLSECDETLKAGGVLLPFSFQIQPWTPDD